MLKIRAFNEKTKRWRWIDPNEPLKLTLTPEEITSRWLEGGGALVEWSEILSDTIYSLAIELKNTLNNNCAAEGNEMYSGLPGLPAEDVFNEGVSCLGIGGKEDFAHHIEFRTTNHVVLLKPETSLYIQITGDSPPTTGSLTILLFKLFQF